ncbi:MAG TPA: SCP2 sterol-binding domain-containing protein [Spirochaetota bacterium]|nr:SCP2 sterol-binding domain-containing protein [Spirochaetota bacterium]HPJ36411.1 SCP2 sterol-binding domain-containing protein [Spirochaetota bacterium]
MKFKLLLFILGKKLIKKTGKDAEFKKKVSEKNCVVQIKTADNSKGRYFTFNNGEITSTGGIADNPAVSLTWSDAATAFNAMKSGKTMEALQNGSLKLEGDGPTALWFAGIAKEAK